MSKNTPPFWQQKSLFELSHDEWESLCDGCGRCCLVKLEDEENGELHYTSVACRLLDHDSCRCKNYSKRLQLVSECAQISPHKPDQFEWLPPTCAYRLLAEGKELLPWHPLISGSADTVHQAGISIRGWAVSEEFIEEDFYQEFIIDWPE